MSPPPLHIDHWTTKHPVDKDDILAYCGFLGKNLSKHLKKIITTNLIFFGYSPYHRVNIYVVFSLKNKEIYKILARKTVDVGLVHTLAFEVQSMNLNCI